MTDTNFNIVNLFFSAAEKYPHKTALIYKGSSVTFSELEKHVKETAAYFQSKGIEKGDRVLLFIPMGIDLYRVMLALFYMGATAVVLDEWVSKKRMEECCKVAQCKAFVGIWKARFLSLFSRELNKIPIKLGLQYEAVDLSFHNSTKTNKSDTALITFTTGSTGIPKAAKRTHGLLYEQFNALLEKLSPNPDDIDMPVLPIVLLINLGAGCTSVVADFNIGKPDSLDSEKIYKQVIRHKVTRFTASPFFVKHLSEYFIENKLKAPTVQKVFTGGAPVFPSEAQIYAQAFPKAEIEIVYGSTEAEPISSINANELKDHKLLKGLNVGFPYRKTEVKIIEIRQEPILCSGFGDFDKLALPSETIGEIIVRGPHVLTEYYNNEEALRQNKIFIGDQCWHRTGDSGYIKDGILYLTGRCNTLIYLDGKTIAPFVYEGIFQSVMGVEVGTVLSINDEPVIILELKKGISEEEILQKVPQLDVAFDKIWFIPKMPRDPRHNSKIDYARLKSFF